MKPHPRSPRRDWGQRGGWQHRNHVDPPGERHVHEPIEFSESTGEVPADLLGA